jgi:hypothetical protein
VPVPFFAFFSSFLGKPIGSGDWSFPAGRAALDPSFENVNSVTGGNLLAVAHRDRRFERAEDQTVTLKDEDVSLQVWKREARLVGGSVS